MLVPAKKFFRLRFCRASECGVLFFICSSCDRGNRYCSATCRKLARRIQWRAASRRHQGSPEGRLDHRDRQRSYRQRRVALAQGAQSDDVTHQGSQAEATRRTLMSFSPRRVRQSGRRPSHKARSDFGALVCQFCDLVGRFVNPFYVPT